MSKLRKILYPFSILFGEITDMRNKAYDKNILTSSTFDLPVIAVGNLSTGGTGKTPQVEYLIRLLNDTYKIAVLSRGYKRKSEGFQIADKDSNAQQIGDEPLQYFRKFEDIIVAVDTDRVNGINELQNLDIPPDIILLDDAFQHRKVNAGLNILLTTHEKLYIDDIVLPAGDLREKKSGAARADIIIVTKCNKQLSEEEQFKTSQKLNPELNQTVFFSKIVYEDSVKSKSDEIKIDELFNFDVLLVTGIAKTQPLIDFLNNKKIRFKHLKYPDHHNFTINEIGKIENEFLKISNKKKIILTTEKDFVRTFEEVNNKVYYLPIITKFISNENDFNKLIINYVQQNTRNS
ncbi:MAG: tetraacyldisaccharide 4'-kinase [Bacteroidota bacterium]